MKIDNKALKIATISTLIFYFLGAIFIGYIYFQELNFNNSCSASDYSPCKTILSFVSKSFYYIGLLGILIFIILYYMLYENHTIRYKIENEVKK